MCFPSNNSNIFDNISVPVDLTRNICKTKAIRATVFYNIAYINVFHEFNRNRYSDFVFCTFPYADLRNWSFSLIETFIFRVLINYYFYRHIQQGSSKSSTPPLLRLSHSSWLPPSDVFALGDRTTYSDFNPFSYALRTFMLLYISPLFNYSDVYNSIFFFAFLGRINNDIDNDPLLYIW